MSSDDKCLSVDRQVILVATALMPSVMAVMNLATLLRSATTRFLHQKHDTSMADHIQSIITPTTRGTNHALIMVPDIGDITADHSSAPIYTLTEAADLEGTPCTLPPATTSAHAILQPIETPITLHTMIPTGIVVPHPTLTISPADITHATPWTGADLTPAAPTTQHKNLSPGKSINPQDP